MPSPGDLFDHFEYLESQDATSCEFHSIAESEAIYIQGSDDTLTIPADCSEDFPAPLVKEVHQDMQGDFNSHTSLGAVAVDSEDGGAEDVACASASDGSHEDTTCGVYASPNRWSQLSETTRGRPDRGCELTMVVSPSVEGCRRGAQPREDFSKCLGLPVWPLLDAGECTADSDNTDDHAVERNNAECASDEEQAQMRNTGTANVCDASAGMRSGQGTRQGVEVAAGPLAPWRPSLWSRGDPQESSTTRTVPQPMGPESPHGQGMQYKILREATERIDADGEVPSPSPPVPPQHRPRALPDGAHLFSRGKCKFGMNCRHRHFVAYLAGISAR